MTYVPEIGEMIPVHLPYETIRAEVIHVFNDDEIAVNLNVRPQGKSHDYREQDWVRCVRTPGTVSGFIWDAVAKIEKPPQAPVAEPTGKRRGRA
jgi:hypothetical protein